MMHMLGVEFAARFACPPNSRNYCGKPTFRKAFSDFLKDKSAVNRAALECEIKKFKEHYPYLSLIAKAGKLKPFDIRVAQALWIGSPLLLKVRKKSIAGLIRNGFTGPGKLSKPRAERLVNNLPDGFVPHHSFHVLYIHTISDVIEPNVENADMCRVSWGRVTKIENGFVKAQSQKLTMNGGRLALVPCKKRWRTTCSGINLLPDAKAGDIVASHWGVAVMKLSAAQRRRLERFTLQNISIANECLYQI